MFALLNNNRDFLENRHSRYIEAMSIFSPQKDLLALNSMSIRVKLSMHKIKIHKNRCLANFLKGWIHKSFTINLLISSKIRWSHRRCWKSLLWYHELLAFCAKEILAQMDSHLAGLDNIFLATIFDVEFLLLLECWKFYF